MALTYDAIATQTLNTGTTTVNFNSISSAYTDLKLVMEVMGTNGSELYLRFNGVNTGNLYIQGRLQADGSSVSRGFFRSQNQFYMNWPFTFQGNTTKYFWVVDILSYASSVNKSLLWSNSMNAGGSQCLSIAYGTWKSTNAINAINIVNSNGNNFNAGSTFTLYGITRA